MATRACFVGAKCAAFGKLDWRLRVGSTSLRRAEAVARAPKGIYGGLRLLHLRKRPFTAALVTGPNGRLETVTGITSAGGDPPDCLLVRGSAPPTGAAVQSESLGSSGLARRRVALRRFHRRPFTRTTRNASHDLQQRSSSSTTSGPRSRRVSIHAHQSHSDASSSRTLMVGEPTSVNGTHGAASPGSSDSIFTSSFFPRAWCRSTSRSMSTLARSRQFGQLVGSSAWKNAWRASGWPSPRR